MGADHHHAIPSLTKERPLVIALLLTSLFLGVEIVGGLMTGSLALLSDAAHMLTDVTALVIALAAIRLGRRPAADIMRTFGYYRFEILAAAFNAVLLFFVAIYIFYEAYQRFQSPVEVQSLGMLLVASIGLLVNLISMRLLSSGKEHSLNIKAAYLEVWSDMLGSLGVIVGAIIIYFFGWTFIDALIAIIISVWILPRTFVLLRESINILLEGVPPSVNVAKLKTEVGNIPGILSLHELHIWAITSGKISLTAHVVVDASYDHERVLNALRELLASQFNISHTTLECERKECVAVDQDCHFN